ncbi:MAG TPA: AsmA-like C-terminal region-containing protein [Chthoniobacterales bacterium]|nr:AsmA-like C-terminal region-containing protein [Chthoniobacterales bacterium]
MRFLSKFFATFLAILLAILLLGTLVINGILLFSSLHENVQKRIEESLSMPVTMGRIYFIPWTGFHLGQLIITDVAHGRSVEAFSISFVPEYRSLMQRASTAPLSMINRLLSKLAYADEVQGVDGAQKLSVQKLLDASSTGATKQFAAEVEYQVVGGPRDRLRRAELEQPEGRAERERASQFGKQSNEWSGGLRIGKIMLNKQFFLKHIKASVSSTKEGFSIDPLTAKVAKGKLQGALLIQREEGGSAYQLTTQFTEVSLKELMVNGGINALAGTVQGKCTLSGILGNSEKIQGFGTLEVMNMQLKPDNFLAQLGQLLRIEELQILKLHEATADYTIIPHRAIVKSLKLSSENLRIRANGFLFFDGALDLNARLLINAKLQGRLQGFLPEGLLPSAEIGYAEIPFKIRGTVDHPQSDLLSKISLPVINNKNVKGLIQGLLNF